MARSNPYCDVSESNRRNVTPRRTRREREREKERAESGERRDVDRRGKEREKERTGSPSSFPLVNHVSYPVLLPTFSTGRSFVGPSRISLWIPSRVSLPSPGRSVLKRSVGSLSFLILRFSFSPFPSFSRLCQSLALAFTTSRQFPCQSP